jgi:nitroreductase
MDVFEALYTTRAMRRMNPEPVPMAVQARIMDAAIRAPSGGNMQNWRFLLVDDPDVRGRLAPLYKDSIAQLWKTVYAAPLAAADAGPDDAESIQLKRIVKSAQHLADHFAEVPLFLFAFAQGDPSGGSIFPAVWSAQLAARAEGVGSALTTVMAYFHGDEAFEILGVPGGDGWIMSCCVAFGYPTGKWGVAARRPVHEVTNRNQWGAPAGFEVPEPLWSPSGASSR